MISFDKGSKKCIINSDADAQNFMEAIIKRTISFLIEEVHVKIIKSNYKLNEVENLNLNSLTSIITIEDCARMTMFFSFEDKLIDEIFKRYTQNIDINENETQYFIEETSGDMINVVVGNVLMDFEQPGVAFAISTPIIISKAQNIVKYKAQRVFSADVLTEYGKFSKFCVMPGDVFYRNISL